MSNLLAGKIAVRSWSLYFCPQRPQLVAFWSGNILIMGRPKDEHYWNQVEKLKDGKLQCRRCRHKFKGGVSRIKAHVDRIQGQGIKLCDIGSVRDNEGVDNNVAGSSNPHGVVNPVNSLQDWTQVEYDNLNCKMKELLDNLNHEEDNVKGELQWLESHGKKPKRSVDDWLRKARELKERVHKTIEFWGQLTEDLTGEFKGHIARKPLVLWNELVGLNFEENFKNVLRLLGEDEVFIIGIHGMGGVGKTCLVTHVKDQITRKDTYNFKHVIWVTISQNFNIFKLQNYIAKRIGLTIDEDDETMRAELLSSALEKNEKWVLILDDVWNYIDLHKVGIPLGRNGTKLILTSRLKHVCQQMDCSPNNIILMEPCLGEFEGEDEYEDKSWELFLLKLGYHGTSATLPPEVEDVASSVAKECDGLPLGISVMARTMKGVKDISHWRHCFNKLQSSAVGVGGEVEEEVFKVLKISYDNLKDINMQKCFLNCALYFEIDYRDKGEFIMKFVDVGLINGMRSLEEIFDEGVVILDKLISHSLLLEDGSGYLRMHGLVRDMACHIMGHRYMVKCNTGLRNRKMPHIQEWTADLEVVSLANNMIEEIPASTSPQCPKLCTLIFIHNLFSCIPDCFFSHMNALTVLDLSENYCLTCLPNTLSNLRSLVSLVLRGCKSLKYVPPLGELQKLSRLDISRTAIEKVPQGLEMLINLKWLNLSGNVNLKWELKPGFILSGLTNMQYLNLCDRDMSLAKVKAVDVGRMRMLEYFTSSFYNCTCLNDYVREILDRGCGPSTYYLHSGIVPPLSPYFNFELNILDDRVLSFRDCEEIVHLLPRGLKELRVRENKQWSRCLCDVLSFNGASSLREIWITECPKLERLFCFSASCSFCIYLQNLETLRVSNLENLDVIWKEGITGFLPSDPGGVFYFLKRFDINGSHKLEMLLTPVSLPQIPNLEEMSVSCCDSIKEIFAAEDDYPTITLPKLMKLSLYKLPQLKTICRGIIASESPPEIIVAKCPNLERCTGYKSSHSISAPVTGLVYWYPDVPV